MKISTDIDIDVQNRDEVLKHLPHLAASIITTSETKKHNSSVYFQNIPVNPLTGLASIDYKEADKLGYFKIDFLNLNLLKDITSEEHLVRLMDKEPDWKLLENKEFVKQLFHIHDYFDIINTLKPKTVEQLAMALAIIRPAKRYLVDKTWNEIEKDVWIKPTDGSYYFKKSHSISYALNIVVQMNLLCYN